MPERPLLILPTPTEPAKRSKKIGGGGRPHLPSRDRQAERLTPRFTVLQETLDARRARLRTESSGVIPEEVIVLETVGSIDNFIVAVRNIEGLEWLGEVEEEDIPPDDDFFVADRDGAPKAEKMLRGRLFLILSNHQALQQMLSLWNSWRAGQELPWGFGKWSELFSQLRDVRPWGVRDRLYETGVLDDWKERVEHNAELIPCEIELWFRADHRRRRVARDRVASIVQSLQGVVQNEAIIEEIGYHALLAQLPIGSVSPLIAEAARARRCCWCPGRRGRRRWPCGGHERPAAPAGVPRQARALHPLRQAPAPRQQTLRLVRQTETARGVTMSMSDWEQHEEGGNTVWVCRYGPERATDGA